MNKTIKKAVAIISLILFLLAGISTVINLASEEENGIPEGFVYIDELIPDAILEVRYYSTDNFVGNRIDGYLAPKVILTIEAAETLVVVADELRLKGLLLKIFDGYRPQQAVDHFIRWADDEGDQKMKNKFYPEVDKKDLFRLGYIARRSGHSRGSTVDLTLVDIDSGEELDMGGGFDYFGDLSHHDTDLITEEQLQNRTILREIMEKHGFLAYSEEWWHYTLEHEPYPETYYDFPVR
ncbi:MAG: M15 family metallopeptidase [Atribacterota bacterium]|jgi:D-alanyl-D-alanine dipeptidase|nr:M15 family metallopeptidase [Atribacterota bacterium]